MSRLALRPTRALRFAAIALTLSVVHPAAASAQAGAAVGGAVLGTLAGGYVSMAVITANARRGHYLFSPDDARWELLPVPVLAVTGIVMGARNDARFWRAAGWSAVGLGGGAALGALVGRVAWGPGEGAWAGGIIGGAVGLLVGGAAGALTWPQGIDLPLGRVTVPW